MSEQNAAFAHLRDRLGPVRSLSQRKGFLKRAGILDYAGHWTALHIAVEKPLMNPQDVSGFITNLLKSGPEVLGSFLTGAILTLMVVLALRHVLFARRNDGKSGKLMATIARKDAEIARKDAEIARMDTQIVRFEARLGSVGGKLVEQVDLLTSIPLEKAAVPSPNASNPSATGNFVKLEVRCAQLEGENKTLVQDKQLLEQTIKNLRTELAQVSAERDHLRKSLKRLDDEYARLLDSQSLAEG